jgi:hypothetical protein
MMRTLVRATTTLLLLVAATAPRAFTQTWEDKRPLPHPVVPPPEYQKAIEAGTRTATGAPGPNYWQQWTHYTIDVRLDPATKRVEGRETVTYYNRSSNPLPAVALYLIQNMYAEGAERNSPAEVTGGVQLSRIALAGTELTQLQPRQRGAGYAVEGTNLYVRPPAPVAPGDSIEIQIDWGVKMPQRGRQGWNADNLVFVAYWYPQMAVYDDVGGSPRQTWGRARPRGDPSTVPSAGDFTPTACGTSRGALRRPRCGTRCGSRWRTATGMAAVTSSAAMRSTDPRPPGGRRRGATSVSRSHTTPAGPASRTPGRT